jgi:tRNA-splicing ligase RtcB
MIALRRAGDVVYEASREGAMRVGLRVLSDDVLIEKIRADRSLEQLANVATLPGITGFAMGMPDMHEGYGFPVGGVAATLLPDGVVSPGGIGFDINCGVRLLASPLAARDVPVERLLHELSRSIPTGYGRGGRIELGEADLDRVLDEGAAYLIHDRGMGTEDDLLHTESRGTLPSARAAAVSPQAKRRGADQLGTLGGGNHFMELDRVTEIHDEPAARALGLSTGQLVVLVHTGSRGLGHQVCTDYVRRMDQGLGRLGIALPDRQLACAPLSSPEGQAYFAAMCAAANFAWCNRQAITHRIREVFRRMLGPGATLRLVYDVAHNIAKIEDVDGRRACVHRKGATRAFGPSHPETPAAYASVGQPVIIPGSMGTASFVLVGTDASAHLSLASACHGAGRAMSRGAAKRSVTGAALRRDLAQRGIAVRCPSNAELAEEAPLAYKDVDRVVDVVARAGIATKVARLEPAGVLKG